MPPLPPTPATLFFPRDVLRQIFTVAAASLPIALHPNPGFVTRDTFLFRIAQQNKWCAALALELWWRNLVLSGPYHARHFDGLVARATLRKAEGFAFQTRSFVALECPVRVIRQILRQVEGVRELRMLYSVGGVSLDLFRFPALHTLETLQLQGIDFGSVHPAAPVHPFSFALTSLELDVSNVRLSSLVVAAFLAPTTTRLYLHFNHDHCDTLSLPLTALQNHAPRLLDLKVCYLPHPLDTSVVGYLLEQFWDSLDTLETIECDAVHPSLLAVLPPSVHLVRLGPMSPDQVGELTEVLTHRIAVSTPFLCGLKRVELHLVNPSHCPVGMEGTRARIVAYDQLGDVCRESGIRLVINNKAVVG